MPKTKDSSAPRGSSGRDRLQIGHGRRLEGRTSEGRREALFLLPPLIATLPKMQMPAAVLALVRLPPSELCMNRNNELEKTEVGVARRSEQGERQSMPKSRSSRKFKCSVLIHSLLQVRTLGTSAMTTSYLDAYLDSRLGSTETSWPNRVASTTTYVLVSPTFWNPKDSNNFI